MIFKKRNQNQLIEKKNECESLLRRFSDMDKKELFTLLSTERRGLSAEQVEEKRDEHGWNEIIIKGDKGIWGRLLEAVINPFNVILFFVAAITFITDPSDYITTVIITAMIIASSAIAFVQGERSNAAAEKLSSMISNKADVWRDGKLTEVSIDELVPGDAVKLSAGDMIPGDVRFLTTKDAFISQSALTGESAPVEKFSNIAQAKGESLTDLSNIGFMGSNMVSGSATAVVLTTGNDTYFGSMAKSLSGDKSKNSFERGVDSVSKLLIRFMLVMVPVVFIVNGLTSFEWWESLLFAVTIAVGLTPEMLPMIMTSTLAKGAVTMSKHKVIVKSLSAIQTFGEMDVLCTDKTGTLTEDKIVLEKYMDVHGNDDMRVLRHAFLNSYFQTGLKNLIDLAIINRADENNIKPIYKNYKCVDEIPFDFARRRMSVSLTDQNGKSQLITKGAVEEILFICDYVEYKGEILPIDDALTAEVMGIYEKHNREGLRVIAVAQKNEIDSEKALSVADECHMVLIGFVGFLDPPKESAKIAIDALMEHGVRTVVLTGDSEGVAAKVCNKVGVKTDIIYVGKDVENMSASELAQAVKVCDLFAKISPHQKKRIVGAFQKTGHTVGYMGDGINDAPAIQQADVGISVDSGVDIAKETSDIILLEKDLMVLEQGVLQGRKTFGNIIKYIKMTASSNFGNMFSVLAACAFLPFLPMRPIHIILLNLIYDLSCAAIPWDNVDREFLQKPRKWDASSINKFMLWIGPTSSVFDITTYLLMFFIICPAVVSGAFPQFYGMTYFEISELAKTNTADAGNAIMLFQSVFWSGWFVESMWSQTLVIHLIRTPKIPFLQSRASAPLTMLTFAGIVILTVIPFIPFGNSIGLHGLPLEYFGWLVLTIVLYMALVTLFKNIFVKKYGELL